jgi:NAD dependent epimerase/dehydratase family enzyme
MSVISLEDYLRAVLWLADRPGAVGPYNLTIPNPTTNAEFSDTLARALGRPRVLKVPAFLLRAGLGELSGQMLGDMYVVPQRLQDQGFRFRAPDVSSTIDFALRRR